MTKFISNKQEASNKAKTRRKTKSCRIIMYNKRWISEIASSPRLSSRLRRTRGLLRVVHFKEFPDGVTTWRVSKQ
jgi:hypothetical protein